MKYIALAVLIAATMASAAQAGEPEWTGFLNMIYARPFGIKSVADEQDLKEKPKNWIGTGLIILMPGGQAPLLPSKPPAGQDLDQ